MKQLAVWGDATIGVELTFLHPEQEWYYEDENHRRVLEDYNLMEGFQKIFDWHITKADLKRYYYYQDEPQVDGHCIELATSVTESWPALKRIYDATRRIADDLGMVPLLDNVCSGGGHVHIGIEDNAWKLACMRDMANRPYVGWAFLDPVDNETGRCQAWTVIDARKGLGRSGPTNETFRKSPQMPRGGRLVDNDDLDDPCDVEEDFYIKQRKRDLWCMLASSEVILKDVPDEIPDAGEQTIRHNSEHLEFRCFAAANDWNEQEEHVAFVLAYTRWIKRRLDRGIMAEVEITSVKQIREFTFEKSAREFKKLIKAIGLPWERYEHYVDEFMTARFEKTEWLT